MTEADGRRVRVLVGLCKLVELERDRSVRDYTVLAGPGGNFSTTT